MRTKITNAKYNHVKQLLDAKIKHKEIVAMLGVSISSIDRIRRTANYEGYLEQRKIENAANRKSDVTITGSVQEALFSPVVEEANSKGTLGAEFTHLEDLLLEFMTEQRKSRQQILSEVQELREDVKRLHNQQLPAQATVEEIFSSVSSIAAKMEVNKPKSKRRFLGTSNAN